MYRINPRTTQKARYRVLDYRWANFGWGRHHVTGERVYHPYEVWLYKCNGENPRNEWYKEEPTRIVFPRNISVSGEVPVSHSRTLMEWLAKSKRTYRPIGHSTFQLHTEPLPLEPAKVKDLRTLSVYLQPYMSQASIDALYPPLEVDDSEDDDLDSEEDAEDNEE
jgi:hypothetical protein